MCESKKDETVIVIRPSPSLFSGHQTLAGLQCLSSPHLKELEREKIQIGFRKMVGSASYRLHESALSVLLLRSPLLQ